MRTFACVLKMGGDYFPEHVQILKKQVEKYVPSTERFLCLTDAGDIEGVDTMPLIYNLRGKYSMKELFRLKGPVLVTGLDTVFMKNMDKAWDIIEGSDENDFWLMNSFATTRQYGNSPMGWKGDWNRLIDNYPIDECLKFKLEQECTIKNLKLEGANIRVFNDYFTILSYKRHCSKQRPPDCDIVIFHGNPRPHQVQKGWVKDYYK